MIELTRRRSKDAPHESWQIFYGDVHVGTIGLRPGVPVDVDQWGWACGFYPGCDPGEHVSGATATFDQAREQFEAAWAVMLSHRTEADFHAWRDHRDWTARKYAMRARGERMPEQQSNSMMPCPCGARFDSHSLQDNLVHVPHITRAQQSDGIRRR